MGIREIRRMRNMTQEELSNAVGVDSTVISKYESGKVTPPSNRLKLIASALSVSVDSLLDQKPIFELTIPDQVETDFSIVHEDKYIRSDAFLAKAVINQANGICELCRIHFPEGDRFLESHFVVWLKDGGKPTIDNIVALCPNCHKKIHIFNDSKENEKLVKIARRHL